MVSSDRRQNNTAGGQRGRPCARAPIGRRLDARISLNAGGLAVEEFLCRLLRGREKSPRLLHGRYLPTGLVVMALRNASGEAMVEMVSVPSPTP